MSKEWTSIDVCLPPSFGGIPEESELEDKVGGLLENFWKMNQEDRSTLLNLVRKYVDEC